MLCVYVGSALVKRKKTRGPGGEGEDNNQTSFGAKRENLRGSKEWSPHESPCKSGESRGDGRGDKRTGD